MLLVWALPAGAQPSWVAPPEPAVRPSLPRRVEIDADNNRIDDRLDRRQGALRRALKTETVPGRRLLLARELASPVRVELVFQSQVSQPQIDAFVALGGAIDHVYQSVSYGWSGTLPGTAVDALPAAMGATLLVVTSDLDVQLHMDEASRSGRVRDVWAGGFAGAANGVSGSSDITIGIVDSGVDDSHSDLTGRAEYWKDYTTDGEASPRDVRQHGSHVAGIALGSGAAFGAGPGTLKYTDSGDLTGAVANAFPVSMIHLPAALVNFQMNSTFGGGSGALSLVSRSNGVSGVYIQLKSISGSSPLNLTHDLTGNPSQVYTTALPQNSGQTITTFATSNSVSPYPAVGDGFNAFRGVAPGARWAGAKVFTNAGAGSSATIGAALDDLVTQRVAHNIKVVNMSFGIIGTPGLDPTLRSKVNSMVGNGIVAVCSAGNDGPGTAAANQVDDPGRAALALTVGATNDANALTKYTSSGFASPGADEDTKPDLLAPGGSDFYSGILSVDSNDGDTGKPGTADKVANDLLNMKGTSMAAPFAAGSAALVIDAMQKAGSRWDFSSSVQPLLVKMLLCASSTETNAVREVNSGSNPALGRATAPKDLYEGYGILNPDAAVEAVLLPFTGGSLEATTGGGAFDRRAWGRRFEVTGGVAARLTLTVTDGADYDLYLYSGTPDAKGNPVILASSTNAGLGADETISVSTTASGPRYLFVKRVSGSGAWTLATEITSTFCGDGNKTAGEQCDDGNVRNGDCCSSTCTTEANGSPCDDGLFCTVTDTCSSGTCGGKGDPCAGGGDCRSTCNEAADNCFAPGGTACTADALPCSLDACDSSGNCTHTAGNAGTVCRAASGICDVAETCSGVSTACPDNAWASPSTVCRASAGVCDVQEVCTGSSASCPADAFASSLTVCRAGAGACDVFETCTGNSATCPADAFLPSSTACRASAGICDAVESCTGASAACPADAFAPASTTCRSAAGVCDAAEKCSGSSAACPADALAPSTTVCRASAGVCDAAEKCSGSSVSCPADGFAPSSTTCRAAAGVCDTAESCSGADADCPADAFASSATTCRAASGVCDVAESCSGTSAACPADAFAPTSTTCRASGGACDVAETCNGTSKTCPADAFASSATVCRAASGACDVAESCNGTSKTCPADAFASSATVCRAASGACDVAETCNGTSSTCPADAVASSAVTCRASAGECDLVETCNGSAKSCPEDSRVAPGLACSSDGNACTTDTCDGNSALCRHDANAAPCNDGQFCNGSDTCANGSCSVHAGNPCTGADGDGNCAESCNEGADACNAADPNGSSCDDGLPCTVEDACSAGECGGQPSKAPECQDTTTTTTTLPLVLCGDANGDGRLTSTDALGALRTAVNTANCIEDVCDYNGDGRISASDALAILKSAVGQTTDPRCPALVRPSSADWEVPASTVPTSTSTTLPLEP